jgi:hypothetical protein
MGMLLLALALLLLLLQVRLISTAASGFSSMYGTAAAVTAATIAVLTTVFQCPLYSSCRGAQSV